MYLAWEVFLLASKSRQVRRSTKCQKVEKAPKSGQADHHDGAQNQAWKKSSAKAAGMRNGTRLPERAVRNQSCISHHHLLQSPQRTDSQTRPRIPTMAATRFFLAPVSGALVAASLLYTFRHTIAVRTHDTVVNLNDVKYRLDTIDPDNWDKQGKEKISQERLRPAYVPPQKPSVSEEIKARWNVSDPLSICFGVAGTRPRLSLRMHCSLLTLNLSVVLGLVAVIRNTSHLPCRLLPTRITTSLLPTALLVPSRSSPALAPPPRSRSTAPSPAPALVSNLASYRPRVFRSETTQRSPQRNLQRRAPAHPLPVRWALAPRSETTHPALDV